MSDAEGLITDTFGMVIVFDNVIGDASCAEAILIEMIPYALRWNKNRGGTNVHSTYSKPIVLYICTFQTAHKDEIYRNK